MDNILHFCVSLNSLGSDVKGALSLPQTRRTHGIYCKLRIKVMVTLELIQETHAFENLHKKPLDSYNALYSGRAGLNNDFESPGKVPHSSSGKVLWPSECRTGEGRGGYWQSKL